MSKKYDREGGKLHNPKLRAVLFSCVGQIKDTPIRLKTYCMLKRLINKPQIK